MAMTITAKARDATDLSEGIFREIKFSLRFSYVRRREVSDYSTSILELEKKRIAETLIQMEKKFNKLDQRS